MTYRLQSERVRTLKEFTVRLIKGGMRYSHFAALDDVSLSVSPGETIGIIGRNGAGKSTLLKVIAGVLKPQLGAVMVGGRVAPLIELGAGFDSELSGRDNIYLNAAILGFSLKQIRRRFDRIVAFADLPVGFLDAPLRTYSSGMVARLGFAVATEMGDPEILIVDEVLSVGDAAFQEKCMDRIEEFRRLGATTIMVSHEAATIRGLCTRAAWLERGQLRAVGRVDEVLGQYHAFLHEDP